jgi:hexosaminidase
MIPAPKEITYLKGKLPFPDKLRLSSRQAISPELMNTIKLILNTGELGTELLLHRFSPLPATAPDTYVVQIDPDKITISASCDNGFRYGLQSLKQLLHLQRHAGFIPCQQIIDAPQWNWRGLHLDVSRHFFEVDFICQYLDWMASLKLNKFHWHLTDDQGWRIESKLYPQLTAKGAWRREEDGSMYGGFYSQEEIKHIVRYADSLGIEIVPEIDLPGHCQAVLAAYNHFACIPQDFQVLGCWGISEDILCAGNDEVLKFLKELFQEICSLFPGKYIHLGGDEAPKAKWKACPKCQQRIKDHHLKDEEALQSWLFKELTAYLNGLGKEVIAWDEILDGDIDSAPIVSVWRGDGMNAVKLAIANGNRIILCPNHFLYFDWHQAEDKDEPGAFGITTLEKVYGFEPSAYDPQQSSLILGAQANLWTEHMESPERVRYMLFPRIYALAEMLWSHPKQRSWESFQARLQELEAAHETF